MVINSTELQNNFGKYLMLAAKEDIIITRNGTPIAKLTSTDSKNETTVMTVQEKLNEYSFDGKKASFEEFLNLTKESEERYEYIDGEIFLLASPKTVHQVTLTELFVIFYNWFKGKKCTPLVAPYDIELKRSPDNKSIVQPDMMVICDLEEKLDDNDYYKGVPDLVVEILSESTRRKDMIKKLDLYMSCGVKEYWIVNPLNNEISIYLFEDKNISNNMTFKQNEAAHSYVFSGLSVELNSIFPNK
ncbi:type II toxin-antitoxin system Phd/YefM family antitoxin [Bacillus sp. DTU_2020_1000418_1_SI_GHA_SEK_038]|uniref:type II toxin-antitoxin system Phd/YefM family antitoxin n=1 Tax=Bacillus sp. DTU_2020_1000418_1_SI_GHA_SEK_038 TaxID=3077585 RepID=UPI0028E352D4|nr:type II toxin-antitoxin system Phd/YefM family antitoxin [Bacillus sp. DTU_2020_1000418_1_SI_GHA_SEK_038]WNS76615.1 type II toxin-antitoxin system Phd/YefM family antitoxin [Bacillus sp. DTU_2020_1000418_1_SI_GHA_SEK_038]